MNLNREQLFLLWFLICFAYLAFVLLLAAVAAVVALLSEDDRDVEGDAEELGVA